MKKAVGIIFSVVLILSPKIAISGWDIETVDSEDTVGYDSSIKLDQNGHPHISYFDSTNYDLKYASWTGSSWNIQIVDSDMVGYDTSLALDSNGYAHISYRDIDNSNLKYAKWTGSSWSKETVDSSGDLGWATSIVLDSDGYPHISYEESISYTTYPWLGGNLKYAKWTGSSWSKETVDSESEVRYDYPTSIVLDSYGYPHISYCGFTSDKTFLMHIKWDGSSWVKETVDTQGGCSHNSMAIDSNGCLHIAYFVGYVNGEEITDLRYAKWNGSSWLISTVDSTGYVGTGCAIAVDSNNRPQICYHDQSNNKLKYALLNGPNWVFKNVDSGGFMPSITIDANGYPHISYYIGYYFGPSWVGLKYAKWVDNSPTLSWTGEANYESDGLNPESGDSSTIFTYRVNYTDIDNDPPLSGYPRLHIKKGGTEIDGSPFLMHEVDSGDMNYTDGKLYAFTKTGLSDDTTTFAYFFEAKDIFYANATGDATNLTDGPVTRPFAPAEFSIVPSTGSMEYSWVDQSQTEIGYYVCTDTHGRVSLNLGVDRSSWTEAGLSPNMQYSRCIEVCNAAGSSYSNIISSYTLANPPSGLNCTSVFLTSATIVWTDSGATRYAIERSTGISFPVNWQYVKVWADNITGTIYTDSGLSKDTIYWYRVKSYNGDGRINDTPSNQISILTFPRVPSGPSGVVLSTGSIKWEWTDNSNTENGYYVCTSTRGRISSDLGIDASFWIEVGLSPNTEYSRSVEVYNETGSSYSNIVSLYTLSNPPENLTLTASGTTIDLIWSPASEGGNAYYQIERATSEAGPWNVITGLLTLATYRDSSSLDEDTTYYYRVFGYNGNSIRTTESSNIDNAATISKAPTGFNIVPSTGSIQYSWTDKSHVETGYYVCTSTYGRISPDLGTDASSWTESGLTPNTQYSRCIEVYNPAGSAYCNVISSYTLANPPTGLSVVTVAANAVALSWDANRNPPRTRFGLAHSGDNFSTDISSDIVFVSDLTLPATIVYGLSPNTTYWFRVWAYNGDRIQTEYTEEISTKTATTGYLSQPHEGYTEEIDTTEGIKIKVEVPDTAFSVPTKKMEINLVGSGHAKFDSVKAADQATKNKGVTQAYEIIIVDYLNNILSPDDFHDRIRLTFTYPPDLGLAQENQLRIFRLNEATRCWEEQDDCKVNAVANTISLDLNHLSIYKVMSKVTEGFEELIVYPNPFKVREAKDGFVKFINLPNKVTLQIYSIAGELVYDKEYVDTKGGITWNGKNNSGKRAATGIYVYLLKDDNGHKKKGKLSVIW